MLTVVLILVVTVAVMVTVAKISDWSKAIPPDAAVPTVPTDTAAMADALANPNGPPVQAPVQVPAEKAPQ